MWKLSIEDDQGNKTVVNLVRDEYSVGRSEDNTVRLTERNISRRHAKLMRNGTGWLVEDLASYNGCFVNGVRVAEPQRLEHGDLVQLGDYRLEIMDEQVAAGPFKGATVPAIPESHALLSQPDRLVMLAGPTPGAEYPLTAQRVVIGRGEECDIAVNHASVSRVHAEIHALGDGRYEIVDRESANGLRVNGVDLKRSLIDARDTIELGDVVLKFIPAGQIFHPSAEASQPIAAINPANFDRHTPAPGVARGVASTGIPPVFKVFGALVGLGIAVMVGMVALSSKNREAEAGSQVSDGASQILSEAMQLKQNGEVEKAHEKITNELPADSNARQSPEFREIESQWASMLFDLASRSTDPNKKRELLQRISKSITVDQASRTRADNELAALDKGTSIEELPPSPTTPETTAKEATDVKPNEIVRKDPYAEGGKKKTGTQATAVKPKPETPEAPSGPDLMGSATSGDRAKMTASKNGLKAKVASGNASDQEKRMLRGLCRQLGDMSCAN